MLDVAKAAFLAAAGYGRARGQSGGDDGIVIPDANMSGDLTAVEQPGWVSERLKNECVCV